MRQLILSKVKNIMVNKKAGKFVEKMLTACGDSLRAGRSTVIFQADGNDGDDTVKLHDSARAPRGKVVNIIPGGKVLAEFSVDGVLDWAVHHNLAYVVRE